MCVCVGGGGDVVVCVCGGDVVVCVEVLWWACCVCGVCVCGVSVRCVCVSLFV